MVKKVDQHVSTLSQLGSVTKLMDTTNKYVLPKKCSKLLYYYCNTYMFVASISFVNDPNLLNIEPVLYSITVLLRLTY